MTCRPSKDDILRLLYMRVVRNAMQQASSVNMHQYIMYETYTPYNHLKEYLAMMIQNKLIIYIKKEKTFKLLNVDLNFMTKWTNC